MATTKVIPGVLDLNATGADKGLKMNNEVVEDEKKMLQLKDFEKDTLKLSYGKKKHYIIKII